ncbi:uncharacterized protein LOC124453050 [Xenia sp. Carnegie-2017]|uniref:uncharacterized protein LOC124453050 n=1 Tax=Xenia sp. Carnegie-2017 TaxID=2897299 RepID=UPI001F0377E7|nr:uncharacterized protein LOC124453050 [Xenia sp. Carnegie-2017]
MFNADYQEEMNKSKKRKAQVVIFEEPARKAKDKKCKKESLSSFKGGEEMMKNYGFKEIAREVREFGMSGFGKKDRRKMKQAEAESLGARALKKPKMPYPLLMELKKIWKKKDEKQKEEDTAMGLFRKTKKQGNIRKQLPKGSGRWVERSQGLDGGKFRHGIRKIQKQDILKMKTRKS